MSIDIKELELMLGEWIDITGGYFHFDKVRKLVSGKITKTPKSDLNQWRYPFSVVLPGYYGSKPERILYIPIPHERCNLHRYEKSKRTTIEADVFPNIYSAITERDQEYQEYLNLMKKYVKDY